MSASAGLLKIHTTSVAPKLTFLPPAAIAKINALSTFVADSEAEISGLWQQRNAAIQEHMTVRSAHERLVREIAEMPRVRIRETEAYNPDAVIAESEKKALRVKAELDRVSQNLQVKSHRVGATKALLEKISEYAKRLGEPAKLAPKTGRKAIGSPESIDRAQRTVEKLKTDLSAVELAPTTSAEAKLTAIAEIEGLAARGRPDTFNLIENAGPIAWPVAQASGNTVGEQRGPTVNTTNALAIVAWLHRDLMIEKISAEIDALADDEVAIAAADRQKRILELKREILAAEREEELEIMAQGEAVGIILRRPDADPRAVLQLADDAPAPRERPF